VLKNRVYEHTTENRALLVHKPPMLELSLAKRRVSRAPLIFNVTVSQRKVSAVFKAFFKHRFTVRGPHLYTCSSASGSETQPFFNSFFRNSKIPKTLCLSSLVNQSFLLNPLPHSTIFYSLLQASFYESRKILLLSLPFIHPLPALPGITLLLSMCDLCSLPLVIVLSYDLRNV